MYALDLMENGEHVYSYAASVNRARAWMRVYEYLKARTDITDLPPIPADMQLIDMGILLSGYEIAVMEWLEKPEHANWKIGAQSMF